MSSYYWPEELPLRPNADGATLSRPTTWVRTEVERGPAMARKRNTLAITTMRAPYDLDYDEKDILDAFFEVVDQASFWWPDWRIPEGEIGDPLLVRVKPASDAELYDSSISNGRWQVVLTLEIWP